MPASVERPTSVLDRRLVNRQVLARKRHIVGDSHSVVLAPYVVLKRSKQDLSLSELSKAARHKLNY
jgi:hypothetical protein